MPVRKDYTPEFKDQTVRFMRIADLRDAPSDSASGE